MLRIVLIPLFIILLSYNRHMEAFVIFGLAAVTDALDGFIARRFKLKTTLGAYLDPIADKLLLTSAFVALALMGLIPRWLAILVVSRDIIISMGIIIMWLNGYQPEIKPSLLSKCTTFFQIVTIAAALLFSIEDVSAIARIDAPSRAAFLLSACWMTGTCTVMSGLHYIYRGLRFINGRAVQNDGI